jgi:hypothetical protein
MKMGQAVADPENPAVAVPGTMLYAFLNRILITIWITPNLKYTILIPITSSW